MMKSFFRIVAFVLLWISAGIKSSWPEMEAPVQDALAHGSFIFPSWDQIVRVLLLQDYNTRIVCLGVTLLGLASGTIAPFLLLRKRALVSDTLSHGALPGIAAAFIVMGAMGGSGKYLPGLLLGAALSAVFSVGCLMFVSHWTRLKQDAAMGIVLSVTFGMGISLLGIIQKMQTGSAAGLETFIYGKTASMVANDAIWIGLVAAAIVLATLFLYKELALLCFDYSYARSKGWPVHWLDGLLMGLCVATTVIGLQAVGLILMVAFLIIPAAAARFWTHRLGLMVLFSATIGALSGWLGAVCSALLPRMPAGAVIVLVCGAFFILSMLFGQARGTAYRLYERFYLVRSVARQHLLRAMYEYVEANWKLTEPDMKLDFLQVEVPVETLLQIRSWSNSQLKRVIRRAVQQGIVRLSGDGRGCYFTPAGIKDAERVVRNHRLWETYLVAYASIAASQVDHEADRIEHILSPEMVEELELLLKQKKREVPVSVH